MSSYFKISTLSYPLYEGDIRLEYPEILESQTGDSFPCPEDYQKVEDTPLPNFDFEKQTFYELFPQNINGIWCKNFIVRNLTQEELDFREKMKYDSIPDYLKKSGTEPDVIE
jgi:hypothetical protein